MKSRSSWNEPGIVAVFSPEESLRFNKRVVRFTVTQSTIGKLKNQIDLSYPDLAIIRIQSNNVHLVNELYSSFPEVFFVDCLVQYRIDLEKIALKKDHFPVDLDILIAEKSHFGELDHLVSESFSGYENHYGRNPALSEFDLVSIYQEWVRSSIMSQDKTCLLFFSNEVPCGFFTAETSGRTFRGLLSGVDPRYRGSGFFRQIIRSVKSIFRGSGATEIVTNVILENRPVHKVLQDEGFSISNSFFTVHLNLRTAHTLPPSRRWARKIKSLTTVPIQRRSRFTEITESSY
ncbi:MAG: hypothetical protein ACP5U1_09700 [Desulfomonilaceae bacterium]